MAYSEQAPPAPRGIRIRKRRVAGVLVVIVGVAVLSLAWRAASSSGRLSESGGAASTGRLGLGEADGAVPDGTTVFDDQVPGVAKLSSDLLGAVRRAATSAADDGVRFYVDSGWRSAEYQKRLLREAISKYGSEAEATRWVATPSTSAHVKGEAVDIGPSRAAAWLSRHGAAYGLCQVYANEPWHYELRPDAADRGCPAIYADPTHDPRMHHHTKGSET